MPVLRKYRQPEGGILPGFYWNSSLNMAQPEAGEGVGERRVERLRLNAFPRPARAKQMAERMMSFFIVFQTYSSSGGARSRVAQLRHGRLSSDRPVTEP